MLKETFTGSGRRFLLAFVAYALPLFAYSQTRLSLEEAATRIGEVVTFEAEVKGAASSPSFPATYVNFGNAYPMQTLSVLFADEHEEILQNLPRLKGRTVRVTGKVEKTKKGPVIRMTDAKNFLVLPPKAAASLDDDCDGKAGRKLISAALMRLLEDGNYAALEEIADKWTNGKERFMDGHWKMATFHGAFLPGNSRSGMTKKVLIDLMDDWNKAYPDSLRPKTIKADLLVDLAWDARGYDYAHAVTDEGWRLFRERLSAARAELETVRDRRKESYHWYVVMQVIALGQGWDRDEYEALYEEAVALEPEYHSFHYLKARHLQSKWYGAEGEWEAFAKSLAERFPGGVGEELYARVVWGMRGEVDNEIKKTGGRFFENTECEWPLLKAGFERLRAKYPKSLWILNNYAIFAGKADDRETTHRLLLELGDNFDMSIWLTWENVAIARTWAAGRKIPGTYFVLFR